jgi:SHAQKYF class myb-like DNA-binding protein
MPRLLLNLPQTRLKRPFLFSLFFPCVSSFVRYFVSFSTRMPSSSNAPKSPRYAIQTMSHRDQQMLGSNTAHQMYNMDKLLADGCTIIDNRVYNAKGYRICAELNQHDRPCQRIGRCPFHTRGEERRSLGNLSMDADAASAFRPMVEPEPYFQDPALESSIQHLSHPCNIAAATAMDMRALNAVIDYTDGVTSFASHFQDTLDDSATHRKLQEKLLPDGENLSVISRSQDLDVKDKFPPQDLLWPGDQGCSVGAKRLPYKKGWTKEEHLRFLRGLAIYGRGSWKQIGAVVQTRTPTQVQSHAQKYFLRQKQTKKVKKSIHDLQLSISHWTPQTPCCECSCLNGCLPVSAQEPCQMLLGGYRQQSIPMNEEVAVVQTGNIDAIGVYGIELQNLLTGEIHGPSSFA